MSVLQRYDTYLTVKLMKICKIFLDLEGPTITEIFDFYIVDTAQFFFTEIL